MNPEDYQIMNDGTHARMMGEFDSWSDDKQAEYWEVVAKFEYLNPELVH